MSGEAGEPSAGDSPRSPDPTPTVSRFVVLGDSFTAGTGCAPGERWADRVAEALRAVHGPLEYHNLAVDGATSAAVLEQVERAARLEPDLAIVICGANDVLFTRRPDTEGYRERLGSAFSRLREAMPGIAILTSTSPESWRFLVLGRRTAARLADGLRRFNEATRQVAAAHGVPCLDVARHDGLADPANFLPDGLHPSPAGHEGAAREIAAALRAQLGIESALARCT